MEPEEEYNKYKCKLEYEYELDSLDFKRDEIYQKYIQRTKYSWPDAESYQARVERLAKKYPAVAAAKQHLDEMMALADNEE